MYQIDKQIVYVSGLPRSGSTLLCQLLNHHKDIYSTGYSSPLSNLIETIRQSVSSNNFFLSQLDVDFDIAYSRLNRSYKAFINGWLDDTDKNIIVDKSRAWLGMLQTVYTLDPKYKMIVCVRDLVQLYGSIDQQHKKTMLISYADSHTTNSSWYRADQAYSSNGVVGGPLRAIENLQDIDKEYKADCNIYFLKYEELVLNTKNELSKLSKFLGIDKFELDIDNLEVRPHETDSHYRFKFRHNTHSSVLPMNQHKVSKRIASEIVQKFSWYYDFFYPDLYKDLRSLQIPKTSFGSSRQGDNNGQAQA